MSRPTVLITGASSGIGESLAREYARLGYDLVLCARRVDRLTQLAQELNALGAQAEAVACDVTQVSQVEAAFARARQRFGRLDVVIANAGVGYTRSLEKSSWSDIEDTFRTNVEGVFHTTKAALPLLKESRGKLVFIGSAMSYLALPESAAYCISKFGVRAFADSIRSELKPYGIRVILVCPGFVATEIRTTQGTRRDPIPGWLNMPAATAARQIARGVARGSKELHITFHAKVAIFVERHFPWLIDFGMWLSSSWGDKMTKDMNK